MFAAPCSLDAAFQHHRAGRVSEAEGVCRDVLRADPDNAEASHLLGLIAHQVGRHDEAVTLLRRAIGGNPGAVLYRSNLAAVLGETGRAAEAAAELLQAVRLWPEHPESHNNLGVALQSLGHLAEAMEAMNRAIELRPDYPEAYLNLGNVLGKLRQPEESVAAYEKALRFRPDYALAHHNLAEALQDLGRTEDALARFRRVAELRPESAAAHSDLLFALHYQVALAPQAVLDEHKAWTRRFAPVLEHTIRHADRRTNRHSRLRVGYVSADFRDHAVARFVLPVLDNHDRERVAVYCYSDVAPPDAMTALFRGVADEWRDTNRLDDDAVYDLVLHDEVDVLVDLTGHIARNRMPVFARKPAPVQMTYIGYPGSTGVDAIDFRITDSLTDPPGLTERWHVESLLRLPECAWCYDPALGSGIAPVAALPAASSGRITFGSLNRLAKLTAPTIALWARVLDAVRGSSLHLLASGGEANVTARRVLECGGIPGGRLTLVDQRSRWRYLELAGAIDIALDMFPYHGMTTTCDLLWMGVPTVTLVGETTVSRVGLSILSTVGLRSLTADTPDAYVETAARLAADLPALATLRAGLRDRVRSSALSDGRRVARALEEAYARAFMAVSSARS